MQLDATWNWCLWIPPFDNISLKAGQAYMILAPKTSLASGQHCSINTASTKKNLSKVWWPHKATMIFSTMETPTYTTEPLFGFMKQFPPSGLKHPTCEATKGIWCEATLRRAKVFDVTPLVDHFPDGYQCLDATCRQIPGGLGSRESPGLRFRFSISSWR